jgi:FAD/FMN-containing dehydrogenase
LAKTKSSLKKVLLIGSFLFFAYAIAVFVYYSAAPSFEDYCPLWFIKDSSLQGKVINDASCLNPTPVYDIIKVKTIEDIRNALGVARDKKLHVSIAGKRHSMGGQAFFENALVLDMMHFNRILSLDESAKILTVQSGATWHDIQLFLNAKKLAVKAMQSTDIFTVGGSLSVNAHGMDHTAGALASTVRSFTILLADGTIQKVTRDTNAELFNAAIGGYGLFGVILEVELEVTDNVLYQLDVSHIKYMEFPDFFKKVAQNHTYDLLYAHLSSSPFSFFQDMIVYGYKKVPGTEPVVTPLRKVSLVNMRRFLLNLSKKRTYAQIVKWLLEKYIDPYIALPLKRERFISRNQVMHDSVEYLENVLSHETDILQEYFIPQHRFVEFIADIREILKKRKALVLNASVRVVPRESILLNYAPQDMFALVLYLNQQVTPGALESMKQLTQELINLVLQYGGTFFLPYQLYFTKEQLHKAYPSVATFFELKKKYDPSLIFMNYFYAKYAPS